jgi:hypothetical protein
VLSPESNSFLRPRALEPLLDCQARRPWRFFLEPFFAMPPDVPPSITCVSRLRNEPIGRQLPRIGRQTSAATVRAATRKLANQVSMLSENATRNLWQLACLSSPARFFKSIRIRCTAASFAIGAALLLALIGGLARAPKTVGGPTRQRRPSRNSLRGAAVMALALLSAGGLERVSWRFPGSAPA